MRVKRATSNKPQKTEGYIMKYFGPDISKILVPNSRNIQNCPIPYVEHHEAEAVLGRFLQRDPELDKFIVFTGLTGSGKTTILRHVFGIEQNSNSVQIVGRTAIIPIDFNRSQVSAEMAILSSVRSAVGKLCKTYGVDEPTLDNPGFFQFVSEVRDDFLMLDVEHDEATPPHDRLKALHNKLPVAFASCQLQYVLSSPDCGIELVLLIVDNVEGFKGKGSERLKYLEPVIEALHLYECVSQRAQPTNWSFNMVIACRHYVWRLLKGEEDENGSVSPLLESFITTENAYDLSDPVAIDQIVGARERAFSRNQSSERWATSVSVVKTILQKMEGTIGDFVVQLNLKDLRKSMSDMQRLILHKGLQKKSDDEIAGAFSISSPEQFDLSRINLIRTLALGNHTHYSGDGLIPNLLRNHREEGAELYPLVTLKYFLEQCGYEEPEWDNSVSVEGFYRDMRELFGFEGNQFDRRFKSSVRYFLKHRILLRSADQQQDEVPGLTYREIDAIESVYVSGAAVRLWDEMGKSSALFQLYMDDVFVEKESPYMEPNGNDIEHCFEYLKYLSSAEERMFNKGSNLGRWHARRYVQLLGQERICKHLAEGLVRSLDYIRDHDETPAGIRAGQTFVAVKSFADSLKDWDVRK